MSWKQWLGLLLALWAGIFFAKCVNGAELQHTNVQQQQEEETGEFQEMFPGAVILVPVPANYNGASPEKVLKSNPYYKPNFMPVQKEKTARPGYFVRFIQWLFGR